MNHSIRQDERSLRLGSALACVIRSLGLPIKVVVEKDGEFFSNKAFSIMEVRQISEVGHSAINTAYGPGDRIRIGRP